MTDKEQINDSLKNRDCKYYHPNNKCGLKAWCVLNAKKCNVNADYCQLKLREQLERKTQECELKQQIIDELGSECKRISANYIKDEKRYLKALEEIEGLAMNLRTRTDYHSLDEVNVDIENILDIIRKAKGEE